MSIMVSQITSNLTHWGWETHIYVSKIIIVGSDSGLSPDWRPAIIWTNAGILLIRPFGINFSGILIEINTFSFKKMYSEMPSAKWRLFHLGLDKLTQQLLQARKKGNIKALALLVLCVGNQLVTSGFPSQMARNVESVSMWWCHHENVDHGCCLLISQQPDTSLQVQVLYSYCTKTWSSLSLQMA